MNLDLAAGTRAHTKKWKRHMARWKHALIAITLVAPILAPATVQAQQPRKPNVVIIWGDDIGQSNVSAYSRGMMAIRHRTSTGLLMKHDVH